MRLHTAAAWVAALFLASSVFGHTVALRLLLLAAGIVLASAVAFKKDVRPLPPVWLPFVLWAAWAALSLAWSLEPERTLKEWRNEVFYTGAALWVCYVGAQAREAARIFVPVLAAAGAVACVVALGEFARGWAQYNAGWHGGPGNHSSALLVLMPCAAMSAWWAVRYKQPRWIVGASFALCALIFASAYNTLSRTIWLGFAVEFAVLGMFLLMRSRMRARIRFLVPAVTLAAAAVCGALLVNVQAERRAVGAGGTLESDSRGLLWPFVIEKIGERPLLGHGFGRGVLRDALQQRLRERDTNLWHAHNYFLDTALQLGVVGLALFLLLLVAIVRTGWRVARAPDDWTAACGMALVAVVAGIIVRNMTDTLLVRQNALLFWGMVGVLLAMRSRWRASS